MGTLRISLFGRVHIEHEDRSNQVKLPRVTQALFAYLLLESDRYYSRELLAELFWGDYPAKQARSSLSTALWRLRRVLEPTGIPKGTYLLSPSTGEVGFNWDSQHWLDVTVFKETAKNLTKKSVQTMNSADIGQLDAALDLCSGDFLEGFYYNWVIRERERLRQLYLDSLEHLMLCCKHQQAYKQSLYYGQQILDQDPLRESIHRELMQIYQQANQPAMAIRQYRACQEALALELNIAPMAETQALHARIVSENCQQKIADHSSPGQSDLQQVLTQLQIALKELQTACTNLQRAAQQLQQYIERLDSKNKTKYRHRL